MLLLFSTTGHRVVKVRVRGGGFLPLHISALQADYLSIILEHLLLTHLHSFNHRIVGVEKHLGSLLLNGLLRLILQYLGQLGQLTLRAEPAGLVHLDLPHQRVFEVLKL